MVFEGKISCRVVVDESCCRYRASSPPFPRRLKYTTPTPNRPPSLTYVAPSRRHRGIETTSYSTQMRNQKAIRIICRFCSSCAPVLTKCDVMIAPTVMSSAHLPVTDQRTYMDPRRAAFGLRRHRSTGSSIVRLDANRQLQLPMRRCDRGFLGSPCRRFGQEG